ncbi:MAG: hypothetical protein GY832_31565 [Chloroflexi bacterium]|nr:hypothetical protein [Chloroflexota bacterium]
MSTNNAINIPSPFDPDSRFKSDTAKALARIRDALGPNSDPTFDSLTLDDLTASRVVGTDADKLLASVNLIDFTAGTANEIAVADDGSGGVTVGLVDPVIVGKGGTGVATLTDHGILLGSGTGAVTPLGAATNGQLPIGSTGADPVLAGLTGTANQITVTGGAGSITLATPQDIATTSDVTFRTINVSLADSADAIGMVNIENTSSSEARYPGFTVYNYQGAVSGHPYCGQYTVGGSKASPSITPASTTLGAFVFGGHNGTEVVETARISALSESTFDATHRDTDLRFYTGLDTGSNLRLIITSAGMVGICEATPAATLEVNGTTRLGDGGSNYMATAADGEMSLAGTARVTKSVWVDAGGIKAPGSKPATAIAHGTLETPAWQFGNEGVEANENTVSCNLKVPEDMDITAVPQLCIGWSTTTVDPGNDSEQVEWQLEYFYIAANESTAAAAEETLYTTGTASATAEGMVITAFSGINLPGASDICMHCRIKRLSSASAGSQEDTVADDVELHGIAFTYTVNKLGTAT